MLIDVPYWILGLQANQKMNSVILKNLYRPDNRSKCTKPNTTTINQCFQFRVKVLMISQHNFGTSVKIYLQNGITMLSCDLELHLLKLFLYSNDRKRWNNIQYTQIRKEHLIVSFLFLTRKELLTIFQVCNVQTAVTWLFIAKKKLGLAPMHQDTSDFIWILVTLAFSW